METPRWFETHAHLSDPKFDSDRDQVIQRAFDNNCHRIIEIADGPQEWDKARTLSEKYNQQVYWAAGLHPYYADQGCDEVFQSIQSFGSHPQFVAIGEVGLDYFKCEISPEVQKRTFITAIELSMKINKPLVVHCRNAYPDLIPILKEFFGTHPSTQNPSPGVIHCFSGDRKNAEDVLKMGFYVGVDGPLTYPNAHALKETMKNIPLDKIVLETDSPYLPPQGYRGKRNEPSYLPLIGQELAQLKGISEKVLAQTLLQNSEILFRLN